MRTALDLIRQIRDELIAKNYPKDLVDQIEKQGFTIANQQGQLTRYETELREAGLDPHTLKPTAVRGAHNISDSIKATIFILKKMF